MGASRVAYRALNDPPAPGPAPAGPPAPDTRKIVQGRRTEYHPGKPVDCTGQLPDGRAFKDLAELQDLLATNEEGLARAFVGQLVTYSTGATVSFADRAAVESILARSRESGYGVRTLLVETVLSPLFSKQ